MGCGAKAGPALTGFNGTPGMLGTPAALAGTGGTDGAFCRRLENKSGISGSSETFFCCRTAFISARKRGVMILSGNSSIIASFGELAMNTGGLIQERTTFQGTAILPCLSAVSATPKGRAIEEVISWWLLISCWRGPGQPPASSAIATVKNLVSPAAET